MKKFLAICSFFLLTACSVGGVELTKNAVFCESEGKQFAPGEAVELVDGCNSCVCSAEGVFENCTKEDCEVAVGLANPAAVKCSVDGFVYEIREDEEGGQFGVCIDEQNKECIAWEYFREECTLGEFEEPVVDEEIHFEANLVDVSGGESSGQASANYTNEKYFHKVAATLPLLEEGFFYEGWLVKGLPISNVISSGVMFAVENEEGRFDLFFEANEDFTNHKKVVITLESGERDDKPEKHILEGDLDEIEN